ncbi:MAG: flagellar basal body P-ring formation chaperone FlgA [Proteobacteria bacterium]|nr:flagellar basal body P-ring formation chaperone FlgA [Pseudomonadota bacterium]
MMKHLLACCAALVLVGEVQALRTLKDLDVLAKEFAQEAAPEAALPHESVRLISLDQQTLAPLLEEACHGTLGDDALSVQCEGFPKIPEGFEGTLQVLAFSPNESKSRFVATLGFDGGEITVKGRLCPTVQVPVLTRHVPAGEAITLEDLEWKRIPSRQVLRTTLTRTEEIIGCLPRSASHKVGAPLRKGDLERPLLVKRGEGVILRAASGRLSIDMQGTSFENGEKGQRIRVLNPVSRRTLYAVVVGPHQVEVESTMRLAQEGAVQ